MSDGGEKDALVSSLLEAMLGGAVVLDTDGLIVRANEAALEILGEDREAFVGRPIQEVGLRITKPDGTPLLPTELLSVRAISSGEPQPMMSETLHRRDGSTRELVVHARPLRSGDIVTGAVVTFLDVTARARAEQKLRRSEENWRLLARSVPDLVIVLDLDGRMLFINSSEEGGTPDILGGYAWDFVDDDRRDAWREKFAEAVATGENVRFNTSGPADRQQRGPRSHYETTLVPVRDEEGRVERVVAVAHNVTERRELMARLAEQDRRTGVGLLAASVAHEILNPLTYVLANIEYALRQPESDPDRLRDALRDAREGALRMKQVVNDLRILGRGRTEHLYVDLRSVLESAIRLAGPALSNATVVMDVPNVPPVPASESQLCQVALNLLVNAGHALRGRAEPREVRVVARSHEETEEISVMVADNGPGMSPRVLSRIFEPFFTTKREGTGLGLSLARDIVTRLGGRIDVTSEEGRGASFTVTLPTTRRASASEPPTTTTSGA